MSSSMLIGRVYDPNAKRVDVLAWQDVHNSISALGNLVDRTGHITMPYRFSIFDKAQMPQFVERFGKSYQEICFERAKSLIDLQNNNKKKINILYSGGIDSTLVLISFLKILEKDEIKDRLVVLMNHKSIQENPQFYYQTIRKTCRFEDSVQMWDLYNGKNLIVDGELNDQLFGSDMLAKIATMFGDEMLHSTCDEKTIVKLWTALGLKKQNAVIWYQILQEQITKKCPIPILTVFQFFWWFNFCFKWQNVCLRGLLRVNESQRDKINREFVVDNIHHFYDSVDFQMWSMTNQHLKIKKNWSSYKFSAKELIYEFTQDENYLYNKMKIGSLYWVFSQKEMAQGLSSEFQFLYDCNLEEYYISDNQWRQSL